MVMSETSSENLKLICYFVQRLWEFEADITKKYAQLILNFFWVVYFIQINVTHMYDSALVDLSVNFNLLHNNCNDDVKQINLLQWIKVALTSLHWKLFSI